MRASSSAMRRLAFVRVAQTIFLDTDTYVIDNIDELFDLLERFDIAAAHAPGYTGDDRGSTPKRTFRFPEQEQSAQRYWPTSMDPGWLNKP
jgi:alpha-N-acetylglucosamine transferase